MDHDWGSNVIDYGLGSMGATLCGVNYESPTLIVCLLNDLRAGHFSLMYVPTDMSTPYIRVGTAPLPGHTRFPYGYFVHPDAPG